MSLVHATPTLNNLIDTLPSKDRQDLLIGCEVVNLVIGEVLSIPGGRMEYVYFPTDSFISQVMPFDGKVSLGIDLVGNDGLCGASVILGINISAFQSVVQCAGQAMRMHLHAFTSELQTNAALLLKLKRYMYVKMILLSKNAACNRFHLFEQRLARQVLMMKDKAHKEKFHVTEEFLCQILDLDHPSLMKALSSLQQKKLMNYTSDHITVLDAKGLEKSACGCYCANKEIYSNIMKN